MAEFPSDEWWVENGLGDYSHWRKLDDDTWVCLGKMLYTTAILVDVMETGYAFRYCFEDRAKAVEELSKMETIDSVPEGYIVRKPELLPTKLIYIGDHFYSESRSMMSPIYTEDGQRYDWGFVQRDLRNGHEVTIRRATAAEKKVYQVRLEELKEKFK
jgi:hypothetical protein